MQDVLDGKTLQVATPASKRKPSKRLAKRTQEEEEAIKVVVVAPAQDEEEMEGKVVLGRMTSARNDREYVPTGRPANVEFSLDDSPEMQDALQRMRDVDYSDSSSDGSDNEQKRDTQNDDEVKLRRHIQRRSSGQSIVTRTKVLRAVPPRFQVLLGRQLKRVDFPMEVEDEVICKAAENSPKYNRFVVLDDGFCDVIAARPDGTEVFIGRIGPGNVIAGTLALGLSSTHLLTIRRAYSQTKTRTGQADAEGDKGRPIELTTYCIPTDEIIDMEEQYKEEIDVLRVRVLSDLHRFVVPHLQRLTSGGFFRHYCSAFVKRVVKNMDIRICRPGELIFKENSPAQCMAVLFCGWIDIFLEKAGPKAVATQGEPGMCFGESALLEDGAVRAATVRCSSEADCLICLLQKTDFLVTLNEFPEEKLRLEEQVRMKMTRLSMQTVFKGCDVTFLHLLSAFADSVELEPGQLIYGDGTENEDLLMVQRGDAVVVKSGEVDIPLIKCSYAGYEAATGLRQGPPDYAIRAGDRGCLFIRITQETLGKAFVYFPTQIAPVLTRTVTEEAPEEHAFKENKHGDLWAIVTKLLCQAFHTQEFDDHLCKSVGPFFKCEIVDPGCTITEENKDSTEMVLLLHGSVQWSVAGKVSTLVEGPRHFNEAVVLGTQKRHTASITSSTTCVLWILSSERIPEMKKKHFNLCKVFEDAAVLRRSVPVQLQARMRSMNTFRRFRSETLSLISANLDIRTFLPGDSIFESGELACSCMYILLRGKAEVISDGKSFFLDEGSTFGEMAMFSQVKRSQTVKANTLCICNAVHRDILAYAFNQLPEDPNVQVKPDVKKGIEIMRNTRVQSSEDKVLKKRPGMAALGMAGEGAVRTPRPSMMQQHRTLVVAKPQAARRGSAIVQTPRKGSKLPSAAPTAARDWDENWESADEESSEDSDEPGAGGANKRGAGFHKQKTNPFLLQALAMKAASAKKNVQNKAGSAGEQPPPVARSGSPGPQETGYPPNKTKSAMNSLRSGVAMMSLMKGQDRDKGSTSTLQKSEDIVSGLADDDDVTQLGEVSQGPQELERRFQNRSCLFHVEAPRFPPADVDLYFAPKLAEEKLSQAFRKLMPPNSAAISASVHGLPSAGRTSKSTNSSLELSRESVTSITGSVRAHRVWPTYTDPLPPLHQQTKLNPTEHAASSTPRRKETERTVAMAAQLQLLASSLLRIHTKPDLKPLVAADMARGEASPKQSATPRDAAYATWAHKGDNGSWRQSKEQVGSDRALTAPRSQKRGVLQSTYLIPKKPGGKRMLPRRPGGARAAETGPVEPLSASDQEDKFPAILEQSSKKLKKMPEEKEELALPTEKKKTRMTLGGANMLFKDLLSRQGPVGEHEDISWLAGEQLSLEKLAGKVRTAELVRGKTMNWSERAQARTLVKGASAVARIELYRSALQQMGVELPPATVTETPAKAGATIAEEAHVVMSTVVPTIAINTAIVPEVDSVKRQEDCQAPAAALVEDVKPPILEQTKPSLSDKEDVPAAAIGEDIQSLIPKMPDQDFADLNDVPGSVIRENVEAPAHEQSKREQAYEYERDAAILVAATTAFVAVVVVKASEIAHLRIESGAGSEDEQLAPQDDRRMIRSSCRCACGNALLPDAQFCRMCGVERPVQAAQVAQGYSSCMCPCGSTLMTDAAMCQMCGADMHEPLQCEPEEWGRPQVPDTARPVRWDNHEEFAPMADDDIASAMAAGSERPGSRKKKSSLCGNESLWPLELESVDPLPPRKTSVGGRRVRVTDPREERASIIEVTSFVCRSLYECHALCAAPN